MRWVVNAAPRPLYPRERPGTYCKGGWLGPRGGLDSCGKSHPQPGFDPRTVQPVASRYTDRATRPFSVKQYHLKNKYLYCICLYDELFKTQCIVVTIRSRIK
jgi:hypothetical protein